MSAFEHTSVLLDEVLEQIAPVTGGVYADVTLGGGGHARAILERSAPDGRLIGTDRDPSALEAAGAKLAEFGDRATLRKARMSDLRDVLTSLDIVHVDGIVADLGVSSAQLSMGSATWASAAVGIASSRPVNRRTSSSTPGLWPTTITRWSASSNAARSSR